MKALCILACVAFVIGQDDKPIVDTHYGKVKGDTGLSREGRMFYEFKGIPYGKAPERFQISEIPNHWEDVRDATKYGPRCLQYDSESKMIIGSEDCLSLNIFTPKLPKEGEHKILLPVVVLLHPGGYNHGCGEVYGPKYFMDEDVVMVSMNSRLGPFGFLNTGDMYSQGNMGLKDQSLALKWVALNIEKFGGDKGRVTLMGASAGAAETLLHLLNPISKGLFSGAVVQSGSPLSPCSFIRDPVHQAKKLGEQVGCPVDSSQALVMCLKNMEPTEILKKMKMPAKDDNLNVEEMIKFGPSIEKLLDGQTENDIAVSDVPGKLLTTGKLVNKVPVIMGITDHDGLMPFTAKIINSTETLKELNEKWTEIAPKILFFKDTAKVPEVVAQKLRDFYFEGKEIGPETKDILIQMFTDRYFATTTRFTAMHYTKYAPVYTYFFNHNPKHRFLDMFGYETLTNGTGHLDELQYLFNFPKMFNVSEITMESGETEYTLSKGMVKLWTSFFENGKPTKTWGEGKEWKKLDNPEKPQYYAIGLETKTMEEPESISKKMNFWVDLYRNQLTAELQTPPEEKF